MIRPPLANKGGDEKNNDYKGSRKRKMQSDLGRLIAENIRLKMMSGKGKGNCDGKSKKKFYKSDWKNGYGGWKNVKGKGKGKGKKKADW